MGIRSYDKPVVSPQLIGDNICRGKQLVPGESDQEN
jgi:hypothetical protein